MHLILNCKIFYKAVSAQRAHSRLQGDPGTLCTPPHIPLWPMNSAGVHSPGPCWDSSTTSPSHTGNAATSQPTEEHLYRNPQRQVMLACCTGGTLLGLFTTAHVCYPLGQSQRGPGEQGCSQPRCWLRALGELPRLHLSPGAPCSH